jgi:hypothetical protein
MALSNTRKFKGIKGKSTKYIDFFEKRKFWGAWSCLVVLG